MWLFSPRKFLELARRRRDLNDWSTKEQLNLLCRRAAGLFVYTMATVKFLDKQSANPRTQLRFSLQSPESSLREARTQFKTNTTLDLPHTSILREAFGNDKDMDNDPRVRSVPCATALAANPLFPSIVARVLSSDVGDVFPRLLWSAQSLIPLQDVDSLVCPFYKSLPDLVVDPGGCTNPRFHVPPPDQHLQLLMGCLDLMHRALESVEASGRCRQLGHQ